MEWMDRLYLYGAIRVQKAGEETKEKLRRFFASQDGVSNVVATIILLLIVVLIIGVFWNRLQDWLQKMLNKIFDEDFTNTKLE